MGTSNKSESKAQNDTSRLETIIELIYQDLLNEGERYKVADLIRAIELKRKLSSNSGTENSFWKMIEKLRSDEPDLAGAKPNLSLDVTKKAKRSHGRRRVGAKL